MPSAYIVIAHGSREKQANDAFLDFLDKFRKENPKKEVEPAFLELCKPDIPAAIEKAVQKGADQLFIVPLMLFPGRHVKEHIPSYIEAAKAKHPEVDFHYAGPLSDQPLLLKAVKGQARKKHAKR